jgi:hypothetical protein
MITDARCEGACGSALGTDQSVQFVSLFDALPGRQVRWNFVAGKYLCDVCNGAWNELKLEEVIPAWRFKNTPKIAAWLRSLGGKAEGE